MKTPASGFIRHPALGIRHSLHTPPTRPVNLWVTRWKKTLIERSALAVPMVALMWAGNPIKTLLLVQIAATIFTTVEFREGSGSVTAG
ncbi:MAG TPA: hypothetical protein VGI81_08180 [Tepidisphaeraceae bacterium]|jgi:hypothetical protein